MKKSQLIKTLLILAAITFLAGGLCRLAQKNNMSLSEYEALHGTADNGSFAQGSGSASAEDASSSGSVTGDRHTPGTDGSLSGNASPQSASEDSDPLTDEASTLTGALLNANSQAERTLYADGFYYEPISNALERYITGVSFPSDDEVATANLVITPDELRYVHILHYDFEGNPREGELICNARIAQDLTEIFYQLYINKYQLESVLLIDEFDADDIASMEANNTSCFCYRSSTDSAILSEHAYGLAVDINPLYNPYVSYEKNGAESVSPVAASDYADRSKNFAYKIDENDLCYKLFTQYGFIWGGNWNNVKDYQHFQKNLP